MVTANDVVSVAASQVGYNGYGTVSNPASKYGVWYGMEYADWCAIFLSWCGYEAAEQFGGKSPFSNILNPKGFAYTPTWANTYKASGDWYTDPKQMKIGDIVFYDYIGRISHVAIVESLGSNSYNTIEGNTSDSSLGRQGNTCRRKTRNYDENVFVGYGRPPYDQSTGNNNSYTPTETNQTAESNTTDLSKPFTVGVLVIFFLIGTIIVFTQLGN